MVMALMAVAAAAAYQCGTPLSNDHDAVKSAFATYKTSFLQDRSSVEGAGTCCVNRGSMTGNDCVSEGTAYAMLVAAYLSDRSTFDCLWKFAKLHMDSAGLMNWRIGPDGSLWGNGGATDADADMAFALLVACDNFGTSEFCSVCRGRNIRTERAPCGETSEFAAC
jgi:endo-1,4-beta-D-glucanase Y